MKKYVGLASATLAIWVCVNVSSLSDNSVILNSQSIWTVEDNILISRLPSFIEKDYSKSHFHISPDGELVAFNILSSDLGTDETTSHLRVFRVDDVKRFADGHKHPLPVFEKTVSSLFSFPGLRNFAWSIDSNSLFYIALESAASELRVWQRGEIRDKPVHGVVSDLYDYQLVGDDYLVAFQVLPEFGSNLDGQSYHAPLIATGHTLPAIILEWNFSKHSRPSRLHVVNWRQSGTSIELDSTTLSSARLGANRMLLSVSPNGSRFAFAEIMTATSLGRCWQNDYLALPAEEQDVPNAGSVQIAFFDIDTKTIRRPFGGPLGTLSGGQGNIEVLWSSDSSIAIAPYTYTDEDFCVDDVTTQPPGAFAYSFASDKTSVITRYGITKNGTPLTRPNSATWSDSNRTVALDLSVWDRSFKTTDAGSVSFQWNNGNWVKVDHAPLPSTSVDEPDDALILEVRQAYNIPPAIYAIGDSGVGRMFFDLAPHGRHKQFGEVEIFNWNDDQGNSWDALLALPLGHKTGERLPLLFQTHGYRKKTFFAEGPTTTLFPGRAALARGFAVLTIDENRNAIFDNRVDEGRNVVNGYKAAIRALDQRGMIDPARVGAIGWSRTSYHVKYALAQEPDLFAAAVVGDGVDYGYLQFMFHTEFSGFGDYLTAYGGDPWSKPEIWRKEAPGFNIDKVRVPVRIEANSKISAVLAEWEFYAGLRRRKMPVDLVVYPDGAHSLVRPSERQTSTQGSIDWLDFWINGFEDPDPAKAEQYTRWRAMREVRCPEQGNNDLPRYCNANGDTP